MMAAANESDRVSGVEGLVCDGRAAAAASSTGMRAEGDKSAGVTAGCVVGAARGRSAAAHNVGARAPAKLRVGESDTIDEVIGAKQGVMAAVAPAADTCKGVKVVALAGRGNFATVAGADEAPRAIVGVGDRMHVAEGIGLGGGASVSATGTSASAKTAPAVGEAARGIATAVFGAIIGGVAAGARAVEPPAT